MGATNGDLVTLLPKNPDAIEVKYFRPISLIHSVAKLISKILAERLAPRKTELVGPHQSAFIRGRCLHDNFQLVQGTARRLHSRGVDSVLWKLDTTKAFDTVDWAFLCEVLRKLGFGERWIGMVGGLLSTSSTCVLLNGEPEALSTTGVD